MLTFVQRALNLSFLSTIYPVTGDPPSCAGAVQVSVRDVGLVSDISGVPGASGTSDYNKRNNVILIISIYIYNDGAPSNLKIKSAALINIWSIG